MSRSDLSSISDSSAEGLRKRHQFPVGEALDKGSNGRNEDSKDEVNYCHLFHDKADKDNELDENLISIYKASTDEGRGALINLEALEDDINEDRRSVTSKDSDYLDCVLHAEGDGFNNVLHFRGEGMQNDLVFGDKPMQNSPVARKKKNYVVDYAHLRRSGYFLEKQKASIPKDVPVGLITSSSNLGATESGRYYVQHWLDKLPKDSLRLRDSDEDFMGMRSHNLYDDPAWYELNSKWMTDEDHFKKIILEYGDAIQYTSTPAKTVPLAELESILERANEAVDKYLENMRKDESYFEFEYVSGIAAFPSSEEEATASKKAPKHNSRLSTWFRSWLPFHDVVDNEEETVQNAETVHPDETIGEESERTTEGLNQIVLEPYHGPVFVNGAIIEAGIAEPVMPKGVVGNIVEEIKAVLRAIHKALRRNDCPSRPPPPVSPASSFYQSQTQMGEDPEIQKLTELLQSKQQKKKTTSRTVFGMRNLEKLPRYNLGVRRRHRLGNDRRGHGGNRFIRAINGWIQRERDASRTIYRQHYPIYRHIVSLEMQQRNQSQHQQNLVQSSRGQTQNQNQLQSQAHAPAQPPAISQSIGQNSNIFSSTLVHMMSKMRSFVPFHIPTSPTPAIPAYQNEEEFDASSPQMGSTGTENTIPSRYRHMRNASARRRQKLARKNRGDPVP